MSYEDIIVSVDEHIGIIKVNRPDKLNAISPKTINELNKAFHELNDNEEVYAIIITGEGKAFISGSDISELKKLTPLSARNYSELGKSLLNYIETMPKPVIAAVNGYALGSGCELAMACDIIIASENAKFGQPEVKLGLIPGHGGTQRLPRLVGIAKSKELIFTGEIISAQEAKEIGLINKVVPEEKLMEEAKKIVQKILSVGRTAVGLAKSAIYRAFMDVGSAYESEAFGICFATEEAKEGISAFLEKRQPKWK